MKADVNNDLSSEEITKVNEELEEMGLEKIKDPAEVEYIESGGKNSYPIIIMENICRFLSSDKVWSGRFRYNEFSHMTEVLDTRSGDWEDLQDHHIAEVLRYVSSHEIGWFAKVSKSMVTDAMISVSYDVIVNPPRDYLLGIKWDGKDRLATWLYHAYGAPRDKVYKAIGSNWMKGLVRRVLHPGCQFDEVLVLEGDQGTRKSSSLRALGDPWHVETTYSTDKDFFQILAKNIIVEFSEGDILTRKGVREVKALITKTEDQYRVPYERAPKTLRRGCVFAMTTNDTQYLKDETGGRRWLPVKLNKTADVDWISENRDQLYAEAVHRVEVLKETSWEYPVDEMRELQEERMEEETHQEKIEDWYLSKSMTKRRNGVTTEEAWIGAVVGEEGAERKIMDRVTQWEIGRAFRKMGLVVKTVRLNDKPCRRWVFTDDTKRRFKGRWNTNPDVTDEKVF